MCKRPTFSANPLPVTGGPLMQRHRFIDIGVNLIDPVFRGIHRGKRKHQDDFKAVLQRATAAGVESMIITGGSLKESKAAVELAKQTGFYCTIGCHPTRSTEFEKHSEGAEGYLRALDGLIQESVNSSGRAVAIGECGLDYDRLHFAPADVQRRYFQLQLGLAKKHHLPLFLHSRAAHTDFVKILKEEGFAQAAGHAVGGRGGVVHSFTGALSEALELIEMGFYISVNGCSLKTQENIAMVKEIPLDRLLLETDAPWCTMTSAHASKQHLDLLEEPLRSFYLPPSVGRPEKFEVGKGVKGRNEPCSTGAVAWVISRLRDVSLETVTESAWDNTVKLFGLEVSRNEAE